jgi:hypothetical protein
MQAARACAEGEFDIYPVFVAADVRRLSSKSEIEGAS